MNEAMKTTSFVVVAAVVVGVAPEQVDLQLGPAARRGQVEGCLCDHGTDPGPVALGGLPADDRRVATHAEQERGARGGFELERSLDQFTRLFDYHPRSVIAPDYVWNDGDEAMWCARRSTSRGSCSPKCRATPA